jgi:ADP-ribose pyrophosphatase
VPRRHRQGLDELISSAELQLSTDPHLVETRLSGSTLLEGGFLEVRKDVVRLPDGGTATREYIQHGGAVAVIPLLDDGRVVLVRQYRYPLAKVLLEWPAGKRDAGESQLHCAMRELQEETGYIATEWAYGGEIHNAAAYSTESIWLWFARGLVPGPARPDSGEFVETVVCTTDELEALADRDELPDVKTQIGLHWLLRVRAGRRALAWHSAETSPGL